MYGERQGQQVGTGNGPHCVQANGPYPAGLSQINAQISCIRAVRRNMHVSYTPLSHCWTNQTRWEDVGGILSVRPAAARRLTELFLFECMKSNLIVASAAVQRWLAGAFFS